ncbi:hypothetical protein [Burkholderia sp. BE17]|uniref:hypothetical protein n=1 Tax=Burkholderia sp. BE17 TaxID=2656644 RepID=UPI00128E5D84|nr:hypothetical protein [Burkholderia sp. BE17]MPV71323.1 hypothetical protein [Burkholderia sp. BE17]
MGVGLSLPSVLVLGLGNNRNLKNASFWAAGGLLHMSTEKGNLKLGDKPSASDLSGEFATTESAVVRAGLSDVMAAL